ncbi:hypothetical protein [Nocardioides halotolerans]|uniref:hypothetical protein n=1 Tax=Nocardioides halotolerans TaxID=433660 RepID=UPI0004234043|nr:hypothetical protein [Nocardioides halotolerans]
MSEHPEDDERIHRRADLLPEEQAAGSDDPEAQAEAILQESDERTDDPSGTRAESTQTPGSDHT